MNEYNERILKNVLQDVREDNDADFLKEIEAAAADPRFQNSEGEEQKFAQKYSKAKKKKIYSFLLKAAVILVVLTIGLTVVPVPVNGSNDSVVQIVFDMVDFRSASVTMDADTAKLLTYAGDYKPSYIPEGYYVETVRKHAASYSIVFRKGDSYMLDYHECTYNSSVNIDTENADDIRYGTVDGNSYMLAIKGNVTQIVVSLENSFLVIGCNDPAVDLIAFAEAVEKK